MQRGERDLGRPDQVEVVVGQAVDLLLGVGQEARAVERLLADEHGRDHGLEAVADELVHRPRDERELEQREVAAQVGEARARQARAALHVDDGAAGFTCCTGRLQPTHLAAHRSRGQSHQRRRRRARQPLVYYAGSASGGIAKTTDGGITWEPIFDDQPVHSIGDIAVAPSDPSTVWAGTGEACIRSHISVGEGIFKSTDAGRTWARMGLEKTGRIGRVVVHPQNPDVVLACALGHAYGPQPERGVFRTTDGGKNWERVLFVDENTGCSELDMDPPNPRKLFAGMWQFDIKTWGRESGGAGQRPVHVERRRHDVDEAARARAAHARGRQGEGGNRAVESRPRLRDDRNRRRHSVERQGDRSRPGVAIGRRRRELARRQLRPQRHGPRRTTTRTSSSRPTTRTKPIS